MDKQKYIAPKILQLSNYVKPKVKEEAGKDWVLNGPNNSFFDYILGRYKGSPTNAALVDAYIDRIYGRGLSIVNSRNNATEYAKLLKILPRKEVRKLVHDYKLFGSAVGQVIYSKSSDRNIIGIYHLDRKSVAPGKMDDEGNITKYWVSNNWKNQLSNKPESFSAFGTSKDNIEVFEIKPYTPGKEYYADPDYFAALQWAMLEEEISNFSISHIQNGLSAGWVITFPNGIPPEEVQEEIERMVYSKTSGSNNAGKIIISFTNGQEEKPIVEAIPTNANHEQWQFWADEARQQIIVGHRVTSPMLFGVKDSTGLGNNANELKEGNALLEKYTVGPAQNEIIDTLEPILMKAGISSPLVFLPLEDEDEKEEKEQGKTQAEQLPSERETQDPPSVIEMKLAESLSCAADELIALGEDEGEEWECILDEEVDYLTDDIKDKLLFASTGTAIPNARSDQDSELFKVRYQYAPLKTSGNSREFCRKMVAAGKVYRKEDILRMGTIAVNPGWGPGGSDTYSIWLYKGGGDCHHKWRRKTYVKKSASPFARPDVDVKSPNAEEISTAEARRRGDRTVNEPEVSTAPKDMPNRGFLTPR